MKAERRATATMASAPRTRVKMRFIVDHSLALEVLQIKTLGRRKEMYFSVPQNPESAIHRRHSILLTLPIKGSGKREVTRGNGGRDGWVREA